MRAVWVMIVLVGCAQQPVPQQTLTHRQPDNCGTPDMYRTCAAPKPLSHPYVVFKAPSHRAIPAEVLPVVETPSPLADLYPE